MMVIVCSSVSTVPVVRDGRSGVRFPAGVRHSFLPEMSKMTLGVQPAYFPQNTGAPSAAVKRNGYEDEYVLHCKNGWSHATAPSI
jgi:hypothetical protein